MTAERALEMIKTSGTERDSQKKILLVDDETGLRRTLREFVESLGFFCVEADSGQRALDLMKKTHFPILISDLVMPEMNGIELLRLVKKKHSHVDVLIVTGYQCRFSPLDIIQAGASDYLEKPFTLDHLAARLSRIEREKALRQRLYSSSITDELTGLHNRRYLYRRLHQETQRAKRQKYPLSLIMFDVDGFKQFNDCHGHIQGDSLLKTVATVMRLSIRENVDSAFRYGGDEFLVILPEADGRTAHAIGNRIKTNFVERVPAGLTLSMGVSELKEDLDMETLIHLADKQMYEEKQNAKDRESSKSKGDPESPDDPLWKLWKRLRSVGAIEVKLSKKRPKTMSGLLRSS
jgi:diguanylate cyclase (GGDEF)-like protein